MQIIIAPARKMTTDTDSLPVHQLPQFLPQTKQILQALRQLSYPEAHHLWWNCSEKIARPNYQWLFEMDLEKQLTPALLAFTGLQYQYMGAGVFTDHQLAYLNRHLRILSGFYGLLRPDDGVVHYRLGMGDRLQVGGTRNLYQFWGDRLARQLCQESSLVLNLASNEYAKAITAYPQAGLQLVTCRFGRVHNHRFRQMTTRAKMARGRMARFLAEQQATSIETVKQFHELNFRYHQELSSPACLTFVESSNENQ